MRALALLLARAALRLLGAAYVLAPPPPAFERVRDVTEWNALVDAARRAGRLHVPPPSAPH